MNEDRVKQDIRRLQKRTKVLYILIGGVAVWLSYACLCDLRFGTDGSAGFLMTAMGVMVTALVGWQVFNAVENSKTLRRVDKLKQELTTYREQARQDAVDNFLHSQALKMIERANDKNIVLSNRYWNGANAIKNLMCGLTPTNYIPMFEALSSMENILDELKSPENELWRYMFVKHQETYEDIYDDIIAAMGTQAKHLEHLRERIKQLRDERVSILKPYQGKSITDYRETTSRRKEAATSPDPDIKADNTKPDAEKTGIN